jgi:hypothetical protein
MLHQGGMKLFAEKLIPRGVQGRSHRSCSAGTGASKQGGAGNCDNGRPEQERASRYESTILCSTATPVDETSNCSFFGMFILHLHIFHLSFGLVCILTANPSMQQ